MGKFYQIDRSYHFNNYINQYIINGIAIIFLNKCITLI